MFDDFLCQLERLCSARPVSQQPSEFFEQLRLSVYPARSLPCTLLTIFPGGRRVRRVRRVAPICRVRRRFVHRDILAAGRGGRHLYGGPVFATAILLPFPIWCDLVFGSAVDS